MAVEAVPPLMVVVTGYLLLLTPSTIFEPTVTTVDLWGMKVTKPAGIVGDYGAIDGAVADDRHGALRCVNNSAERPLP
ncbi:MAG: hypothetical protein EXS43_04200 [Opitutus sp.]|nr:hypothetical protein [Opitutus sp.]